MVLLHLDDQPPLIQSIFAESLKDVEELIEHKQNVNITDCEKRTPLHAAAYMRNTAIANVLLENGARVNAKDSKWITPLHRACSYNSDGLVTLLLSYEADVSARDRLWQTPLHIAAANDSYNCVELLLNYVPNPNVTDRAGRTALHLAAINGHTYVAEVLITSGCIVNACDKKDIRPLHCAVQMGHIDTAELLIKSKADVNAKDRNLYTPLHVATAAGKTTHKFDVYVNFDSVSRMLIHYGAEVDAQNAYGNTPVHIACLNGHLTVLQDLVEAGANLEATNFRGQTPLHIAAASAHGVDCLTYLLTKNVDINKQSLDGRTPLHMTAIHGRFTRSKPLIDKGAFIDCADKNGCTPLHVAAQNGHDLLANTLLNYGANPSKKGYEGRTPLHMCCLSGYVECCRKFLQAGVDLNVKDDKGMTPIHCAAYKGSIECLDLLVSNRANILALDNLNRLPVHYAASQGHYQCVFTLVGIGSPVNAPDIQGCTPLHLAAGYDLDGKCVEYLLDHKANPNAANARSLLPLHYAIAGGNEAATRLLAIPNGQLFGNETTAVTTLHLAAKVGPLALVKPLLSFFREFDIQTKDGVTPLMLAAREGHTQIVQFMLRFDAKVGITTKNNWTALHYSAINGHTQCLSMMLNNTDDKSIVNIMDNQHRTALMLAVSGGFLECVKILLKAGADPNIVDKDNHSCLFRAVVNHQISIVQILLANGANASIIDINGKTVFHVAAACDQYAQLILSYMSKEVARTVDNQQCTALHWACYNGNDHFLSAIIKKNIFNSLEGNSYSPAHCASFSGSNRCLKVLVEMFGKDIVNLKDSRFRTPLHVACVHGHSECVKYLLEQGANVHIQDEEGRTPLISAAQYGQNHVLELLLATKADRTACDKNRNTALHIACLKKHPQCALLMLDDTESEAVINMQNDENKTPLHIAARNGLVEVTRELLKKGASVLAVDNDGLTPALCCAPSNNIAQCLALILRTLPEFVGKHTLENDPLALCPFYQSLLESNSYKSHSVIQTQTTIVMVSDPDLFELKRLFGFKKTKKETCESKNKKLIASSDNYYLVESDDSKDKLITKCEPVGLNLHKSLSDICILSNFNDSDKKPKAKLTDLNEKKKTCYKCKLLQHRCPDCTIRHILKQQLSGKTSQKELKDFVTKTLTETSFDYRKKLNQAVKAVGAEFGLTGTIPKVSRFMISKTCNSKNIIDKFNRETENVKKNDISATSDDDNKLFSDAYMNEVMNNQIKQFSKNIENEQVLKENSLIGICDENVSDECNLNLNEEFLKYLQSLHGSTKLSNQEYIYALACFMNKMLKKFDANFNIPDKDVSEDIEKNYPPVDEDDLKIAEYLGVLKNSPKNKRDNLQERMASDSNISLALKMATCNIFDEKAEASGSSDNEFY